MKIAIAADGNMVSGHFGHSELFHLYDVENGNVINQNTLKNPGHKPGFIPKFLHDHGAECIIVGGMGQKAKQIFDHHGITSLTGIEGEVTAVLDQYLSGSLESGEECCGHHHHGNGHNHGDCRH